MIKIKNPFRKLTLAEARQQIQRAAGNAALHHDLEALRLRYLANTMLAQAAQHECMAHHFEVQEKGHL